MIRHFIHSILVCTIFSAPLAVADETPNLTFVARMKIASGTEREASELLFPTSIRTEKSSIEGPKISGWLLPPCGDWTTSGHANVYWINMKCSAETNDGAYVYLEMTGVYVWDPRLDEPCEDGKLIDYDELVKNGYYDSSGVRFSSSAKGYQWLNSSLFVSKTRQIQCGSDPFIIFDIYKVE